MIPKCPKCNGNLREVKGGWACVDCRALFTDALVKSNGAKEQKNDT